MSGTVVGIYICAEAGEPTESVDRVEAIAGQGLEGDRYATGKGSFNKSRQGSRQVTLMNARFFLASGFSYDECRRNLITEDVELMWLIGREFQIGTARFQGIKYCDPCNRPSTLLHMGNSFKESFLDAGGLIAEVLESGLIQVLDSVVVPDKGY